jgi:hypothetical protein
MQLTEEKRKELKEKFKGEDLSVIKIGDVDFVHRVPSISVIGEIRQKQYELYVAPQQKNFAEKADNAAKDANVVEPVDDDVKKQEENVDDIMAIFVFNIACVFPESRPHLPLLFTFADWFIEKYVYITIGDVEEL